MFDSEQIYPFVPGKAGIPIYKVRPDPNGVRVQGGSGRLLRCVLLPDYLRVSDIDDSRYFMFADLTSGHQQIRLDLRTVIENPNLVRHPDFFARRFIEFALDHFIKHGFNPTNFVGKWSPNSVNYRQFFELLGAFHDRVAAAKDTWSGRVMGNQGFSEVNDSDIYIDPGKRIEVVFQKIPSI